MSDVDQNPSGCRSKERNLPCRESNPGRPVTLLLPTNRPTDRPTDRPTNQPTTQPTNQPT
jgi:hypothetical protein